MPFFRVGMRVKKVRGVRGIGATGVVVGTYFVRNGDPHPFKTGRIMLDGLSVSDIQIKNDSPWENSKGAIRPSGTIGFGSSENWEPIIDKHEPCDTEFKQSLDRLLEKVGERV